MSSNSQYGADDAKRDQSGKHPTNDQKTSEKTQSQPHNAYTEVGPLWASRVAHQRGCASPYPMYAEAVGELSNDLLL
ncbi:hypothetical protein JANAI62_12380 [Jannaschia pagri]|uniref:Uncharacterized protein n=1 Tax=Jannaschia pagri TaxID=2829797 RepID=A0ABQ4NJL9_9RHOB|nr:hypothetical protein JANAI61_12410 [Jannaschia sp. AI_61]GIT94615.1 hypothetical protein JANAI62_12380 [Jannaschia sp. AI_62]